jgi:hypothetical protein
MTTHQPLRPDRLRAGREPGRTRTVLAGAAAVVLLAALVGGMGSALAWAMFQAALLLLS